MAVALGDGMTLCRGQERPRGYGNFVCEENFCGPLVKTEITDPLLPEHPPAELRPQLGLASFQALAMR